MRRRPESHLVIAALAGACLVALPLSGCSLPTMPEVFSGVIDPKIVPATDQQGLQSTERQFDFEDSGVVVRVPVDQAVYTGARRAEKNTIFIGRPQPEDWVQGHYRSFVDEEHQEPFYDALLDALHEVRDEKGLDGSRYVELVTSMAQTMEYRVDPVSLAPKFPIETFGDGYGDCDDKALLAAALLSRDGYDVAIMLFESEKHVALGIRAPGLEYKGTGYAYTEMTQPSFVGVAPETLSGGIELQSQPIVVRIGSGEKSFDAGESISYVDRRMDEVEKAASRLNEEITGESKKLDRVREEVESARRDAQTADPLSGTAPVDRYNSLAAQHNDLVARLNSLVERHNALVEVLRYATEHQTARPQVHERLKGLRL